MSPDALKRQSAATSDTASLLRAVPGLPAIRGLADDRLRIKVDGMDLIASCPNHMNPALSYIDPTALGSLRVYAGISPVSVGGDSIVADSAAPVFAEAGQGTLVQGEIGAAYRNNGDAFSANLAATAALTHTLGGWDNRVELVMVSKKDHLSDARNEIATAGYTLINLRGSYAWQQVRLDFGVENLFDKAYDQPTGGTYTGQGTTMGINSIPWGIAVPGAGRSLYAGVNVKF
ncbi:TonB-dependent receptor plug domain-containing protein [Denitromonas iodatirespirans]|uniref:TonB-dependent receptor n=1 Tax=Denitromonas iodatirespirans TaxID=2795389 RepID=A0A944DFP4_DENI1|nr:TonB-dependent receptor [Denitromonas iodatirespirans]MBT0964126.1 TonB-dependent receptor [Denitromonas iodatirespirans]